MTETELCTLSASAGAQVWGDDGRTRITFSPESLARLLTLVRHKAQMEAFSQGRSDGIKHCVRIFRDWNDGQHDHNSALLHVIEQSDLARIAQGTRP